MRARYSAVLCAALLLLSLAAACAFALSAKAQITPKVARVVGFPVMFVDTLAGKHIGRHDWVSARLDFACSGLSKALSRLCWRYFG